MFTTTPPWDSADFSCQRIGMYLVMPKTPEMWEIIAFELKKRGKV